MPHRGCPIDAGTGVITWTPAGDQLGEHFVTLLVADNRGGVGGQTYNMLVQADPPNAPPVITSLPPLVSTADVLYEYQIEANDPEGTVLVFSLAVGPAGMSIDAVTGLVNWTPTVALAGLHDMEVAVADADGGTGSQAYTVAVNVSNQRPVLNNRPSTRVLVGDEYAWDINVTDADGDPLSYQLTTSPGGMSIDQVGRVRWTPADADVGVARVELLVVDNRGLGLTFGYDLDVLVDETPPQASLSTSSNPAPVNEPVTIAVSAVDDVAVDSVSLMIDGLPVALDGNGRTTSSFGAVGEITLVATATDISGRTAQQTVVLSVIDTSDQG